MSLGQWVGRPNLQDTVYKCQTNLLLCSLTRFAFPTNMSALVSLVGQLS